LGLPARLRAIRPRCRFLALGGATEGAIWSNALEVVQVEPNWRSIPYGYPLANQRYRVVDGRGRDRPDHVAGELWIGGSGVALGYQGDPQTTAARFVEHACERWYKTGDHGRYDRQGQLEFLGRVDTQVKLRGHRIELGEVEAALEAHPAIARAIVARPDRDAGHLVAFVVLADTRFDADELTAFVAARVPKYAVPGFIHPLAALPLSRNGKVDRAALAAAVSPSVPTVRKQLAFEPPRGATEQRLAMLWSELLEVRELGRADGFFDLGGDSLLATRLLEHVRRRFGVALTMRALFLSPNLAEFAALVERERERNSEEWAEGIV
jgi:aryl carrier-like protein